MVDLTDISDARIEVADVTRGFTTELDDAEIKEHIATAHMHVDDRLLNNGLSNSRLARIELFLTRHLIRFTVDGERQVTDESSPSGSQSYAGAFDGESLTATAAGQQAMMLDSSDTLGTQTLDQFFTVG